MQNSQLSRATKKRNVPLPYKQKDSFEAPRREISALCCDLPIGAEMLERAIGIVENMSFRHELAASEGCGDRPAFCREGVEFCIVQDADRLDAIGAVGVARTFAYSGAVKRPLIADASKPWEAYVQMPTPSAASYNAQVKEGGGGGDAFSHIFHKLLKLKALMKTEAGKALAEERHAFLLAFARQFAKECGVPGCESDEA